MNTCVHWIISKDLIYNYRQSRFDLKLPLSFRDITVLKSIELNILLMLLAVLGWTCKFINI